MLRCGEVFSSPSVIGRTTAAGEFHHHGLIYSAGPPLVAFASLPLGSLPWVRLALASRLVLRAPFSQKGATCGKLLNKTG